MVEKLFGATEKEQLEYLENRIITSFGAILVSIILSFFWEYAMGIIAIIAYVWAWELIRKMLGTASLLTYLVGIHNLALAVIFGLFFAILGYLLGLLYMAVGTVWYLALKIRSFKNR